MDNKIKGDIKATLILLAFIIAGVIGGVLLENSNPTKDGGGYVLGFVLGTLTLFLLSSVWILIRIDIED